MFVTYSLFSFCFAVLTKSTVEGLIFNRGSVRNIYFMLTHAYLPPMVWLLACNPGRGPIHSAIWPPTMPDREQVLVRDTVTSIARLTVESNRAEWDETFAFHEIEYSILSLNALIISIGTFIYEVNTKWLALVGGSCKVRGPSLLTGRYRGAVYKRTMTQWAHEAS